VVLAPNGFIYVIGGFTDGAPFDTVEVYYPATDTWDPRASLPTATRGAAATVGLDGKIYVFGGAAASGQTTQIYDPIADSWTTGTNMPIVQWAAGAATAPNGLIYVIGGEDDPNAVQIYNPITDSWASGTPMPTERLEHAVVLGPDGLIYAIGGMDSSDVLILPVEAYDPVTDSWSTKASLPAGRCWMGVSTGLTTTYVMGGGDGSDYLSVNEEASGLDPFKIYVFGGGTEYANNDPPVYADTYVYDPVADSWSTGVAMPTARREQSAATAYQLPGVSVLYGPEKISTGGDEDTPQIAIDSQGNVHIVWVNGSNGYFLMYKMVDPDGNVLIEETNLNPCAANTSAHVRRPSMVIDSADNVHIVFHGFSQYSDFGTGEYGSRIDLRASEVIYLKVDPYLDDMNGDAADFYAITPMPETIISTDDAIRSRAPNIAIDSFGRLHVVWFDAGTSNRDWRKIHYLVMDTSGSVLVAETPITLDMYIDIDWGEPEIATDSMGNAHVTYCRLWDNGTSAANRIYDREIFYMMIDGSTGSHLIDDTCITIIDGNASVRAVVAVDSQDMVHVAWQDRRFYNLGTGEHELFYSQLDPSLDDQSGDAADPSVIRVISELLITSNDTYRTFLKNLAIDPGERVHITYKHMYGLTDPQGDDWDRGQIHYQLRDSFGTPLIPNTRLTNFDTNTAPASWWYSSGRNPAIAVTCNRVYITFNVIPDNEAYDESDIYLIILGVPPCSEAVGGEIIPIHALQLLTPYLLVLLAAGAVGILFKKRIV
jgi:N-acetylneuraminic acid mutarotase